MASVLLGNPTCPKCNDPQVARCRARKKACRKCDYKFTSIPKTCECGYRTKKSDRALDACPKCEKAFPDDQYHLIECPTCKECRFCHQFNDLYENGRCDVHGGITSDGVANGNFKSGLYSEAFKRIGAAKIHNAVMQSDIFDAEDAIKALQARALHVLSGAKGADFWGELSEAWDTLERSRQAVAEAQRNKDEKLLASMELQFQEAYKVFQQLMRGVREEERSFREWERLEEATDKIRDRAHRRAVSQNLLIHWSVADSMLQSWMNAAKTKIFEFVVKRWAKPVEDANELIRDIGFEARRLRGGAGIQYLDGRE